MPSFETPEPITAILDFEVGNVRLTASERTDTVVEVLPSNGAEDVDVRVAQQTKVTYANGTLTVKGPRKRSPFGKHGSIDITVGLPAGSRLNGTTAMGDFTSEGTLGECRVKVSLGDIRLDEAGVTHLRTGHGDIRVHRATGNAEIHGQGRIELGEVTGTAVIKNGNGEITVGEITGDLKANSSNGRISVGLAHDSVDARSANGAIRIDEVVRGVIRLQAAAHDVEIGVRESTAAWLDVNTRVGTVRNALGAAQGPETSEETVEIHARTGVGDIVIRRA
ncbi:DUF4097 domain-containing protein [Streptomyces sp. NBC_01255]|uniref:DUF4097 family beta strand repeat-containing protein n=1 Tax=Streptomyces sp. NBC_01255 TaxID=2903798 RepID=UPI002E33E98B|nr:DUF4097 family beta strand repeat-containing protein [Streptomyces sp. NBC_01255]